MKLSRQQALIMDALCQHVEGCETDRRGTCMRHMRVGGYRYTERVRELRAKLNPIGRDIVARQIGRGHFHYSIQAITPHPGAEVVSTTQPEVPKAGQSELFKAHRVGNVMFEKPGT